MCHVARQGWFPRGGTNRVQVGVSVYVLFHAEPPQYTARRYSTRRYGLVAETLAMPEGFRSFAAQLHVGRHLWVEYGIDATGGAVSVAPLPAVVSLRVGPTIHRWPVLAGHWTHLKPLSGHIRNHLPAVVGAQRHGRRRGPLGARTRIGGLTIPEKVFCRTRALGSLAATLLGRRSAENQRATRGDRSATSSRTRS